MIDYKRNIDSYINENIRQQWKNELLKLKDHHRVSRLQDLQIRIRQEIEILGKLEVDGLEELSQAIYEDTYYHNLYEVTKELGITRVFNTVDTRKVELLNKKGWADDDKNFSERIWGRQDKINNFLQKELTQSIIIGEDPQKVINKLAKTFNTSKSNAGNLILTESAYYTSHAQQAAYNELDVEKFQFIATLDDVTSEICQVMDLQIFKMSEYEVGVTANPLHPRCRSTTIPYFDDNFTERFARFNGETYTVPKDISFAEWKDKYIG